MRRALDGMALSGRRRSKGGRVCRRMRSPRWNTAVAPNRAGREKDATPLKVAPAAPTVRLCSVTPGRPGVQLASAPRQTCATSAAPGS